MLFLMENKKKHIAILGSTGSIGTQALEVISEQSGFFELEVLTANSNSDLLIKQAIQHKPNAVVIADKEKFQEVNDALFSHNIKSLCWRRCFSASGRNGDHRYGFDSFGWLCWP